MNDTQHVTSLDYLQALYGACNRGNIVFVKSTPSGNGKEVAGCFDIQQTDSAAEFVESYQGTDLYLKINVMDHSKTIAKNPYGVGGRDEVDTIVSIHLDVDAGKNDKYLTPEIMLDALDRMPVAPSAIVQTNGDTGGFHAYWLLDEPFYIDTEEDRQQWQTVSSNWLAELRYHAQPGTVDGTANIDRVLRPIGSLRSSGNRVRALTWSPNRRYRLEDFSVPQRQKPQEHFEPVPFNGDSPIEKYLRAVGLDSVEAILQNQGYENLGRGFWRRPGSESGAATGEVFAKDGQPGFTVKSGAADPLCCDNRNGATGNWYSLVALWVSFHCRVDASNGRSPNAFKEAAAYAKAWLDAQAPKADTSHIENQGKSESFRENGRSAETWETQQSSGDPDGKQSPIFRFSKLAREYPTELPPIIDGLLRPGEVMNIIAASKYGKSWLILGLLICIATGRMWLGRCVKRGRVLLVDNELRRETIVKRIRSVAGAMNVDIAELDGWLDVLPLRGRLMDIGGIKRILGTDQSYSMVAIDAFYRVLSAGVSENDNAQMTGMYNAIDGLAAEMKAAMVLNHHSSKGDQAGKSIVDVGSGAGAISRACDSHMILRPHAVESLAVVDVACRSFAPNKPTSIRWEWPLWHTSDVPPELLQPKKPGGRKPKIEEPPPEFERGEDGPFEFWQHSNPFDSEDGL